MLVSEVKGALVAPVPVGPDEGELLGVERGIEPLPAVPVGEGAVELVKGNGAEVASAAEEDKPDGIGAVVKTPDGPGPELDGVIGPPVESVGRLVFETGYGAEV